MTELPERLLREALREPAPAPHACVDAETLAAWAEGTMSRAALAAFEIHAADCARCQALMAAMARTEPPPIEPAWWRRARFSWLMPLAAATAAIVIVVSLSTGERRAPAPQMARIEPEPAAAALPRAEETAPPKAAAPAASAPAATPLSAAPPSAAPPSAAPPSAAEAPPSARADARRDRLSAPAIRPQDQPKTAGGPRAGKAEPRVFDSTANVVSTPPPPLPSRPSAAPAAAPPAIEPAVPAPAAAAAAPANAETGLSFRGRSEDAQARKMVTAAPLVIASPVRDSLWRIVGSAVAHSEDGGVNWRQTQALDADVSIRAGAAPAARVCWLVGARGLVLLTTDAARWRRVAFPEAVDLAAIEAADASHATVTTATGRRFSTSDGGITWIRQ